MKLYIGENPWSTDGGYTGEQIRKGHHWVNADITCPHCGKEQPVAMTGYLGGPCVKCGRLTGEAAQPGQEAR